MLRVILLCVIFFGLNGFIAAQTNFTLELRPIISAEFDTVFVEGGGEEKVALKLSHPFADQKALKEEYYVFQQPKEELFIKEEEFYIVPLL